MEKERIKKARGGGADAASKAPWRQVPPGLAECRAHLTHSPNNGQPRPQHTSQASVSRLPVGGVRGIDAK